MISITEVRTRSHCRLVWTLRQGLCIRPPRHDLRRTVTITLPFDDEDANLLRPMKLDDDDDDTWQTVLGGEKDDSKITLETHEFQYLHCDRPRRGFPACSVAGRCRRVAWS